jgi:hypothetical protein
MKAVQDSEEWFRSNEMGITNHPVCQGFEVIAVPADRSLPSRLKLVYIVMPGPAMADPSTSHVVRTISQRTFDKN